MWRNSFKQFLGLPAALPRGILQQIFTPTELISEVTEERTRQRIQRRFGDGDDTDDEEHSASPDAANNLDNGEDEEQADEEIKNNEDTKESDETEPVPICFKKFPKNFKVLFAFPHKRCNCHNWRMTARQIFRHEGLNFDEWFRNLLDVERQYLK